MASSLEGNKLIAAVLTAGIITSGAGVLARMVYNPHIPDQPAFLVETAAAPAAPAAEAAVEPIEVRLASADPAKGQATAKVCAACHNFEKGGGNKVGPNLYGIVGLQVGKHAEGFAYSEALSGHGGEWSYANLDAFLTSPKAWAPGTKMSFAGLADPTQRANVIAYLRSLAETPLPLPQAPAGGDAPAGGTSQGALESPALPRG